MRVWYAKALHPQLLQLYQAARSLPLSSKPGSCVGWDLIVERLNLYLTQTVQTQVSPERIQHAVRDYPLLEFNRTVLNEVAEEKLMKDIEQDVRTLKHALFNEPTLGATWQTATRHNTHCPWTSSQADRGNPPWKEVHATMHRSGRDSVAEVVAKCARRYTENVIGFQP